MLIYRLLLCFSLFVFSQPNISAEPIGVGQHGDQVPFQRIPIQYQLDLITAETPYLPHSAGAYNFRYMGQGFHCPDLFTWKTAVGEGGVGTAYKCGNSGFVLMTVNVYKNILNRLTASEIKINKLDEIITILQGNNSTLSDNIDGLTKRLGEIERNNDALMKRLNEIERAKKP